MQLPFTQIDRIGSSAIQRVACTGDVSAACYNSNLFGAIYNILTLTGIITERLAIRFLQRLLRQLLHILPVGEGDTAGYRIGKFVLN